MLLEKVYEFERPPRIVLTFDDFGSIFAHPPYVDFASPEITSIDAEITNFHVFVR